MRSAAALAVCVLGACAPVADAPANLTPAPLQLRAGVTVTVAGQALEVRRTLYRWVRPVVVEVGPGGKVIQPSSPPPGEFADGVPAIAVDGLTPGPGDYETALAAILLACEFADAVEAVARGGLDGDVTAYAPVAPQTFYVSLASCPPLDR